MMTNKDKFKRAFSAVQTPDDFALDLEENTMTKNIKLRKAAIAACAALAIVGSSTAVYASDLGGIQRQVQIWFHGDQTTATMTVDQDEDNTTQYSVSDSTGTVVQGGGGVAIDADGTEKTLTEAEIQEHLNAPDVETEDGHVYLYYRNQKMDLTDKFDDDGLCYVTLKSGDKNLYVTVTKDGAYESSTSKYPQKSDMPKEWFEN